MLALASLAYPVFYFALSFFVHRRAAAPLRALR
jgi:hypothetical protein